MTLKHDGTPLYETFTLQINMSNAAFDYYPISELTRCLYDLAETIASGEADYNGGLIRDANGNTIGHYKSTN